MGASASTTLESVTMSGSLAKTIEAEVVKHKVVVYSKTYCPYCTMAKDVFKEMNVSYHLVELDMHPEGSQIQEVLQKMTGARTVPRVFVNGKCIGGGTDTRDLHRQGKLQQMLAD